MGGCMTAPLDTSECVDTSTARPGTAPPLVTIKIAVVGAQGSGKTALVERFLEQRWLPPEETSPTMGVDCSTRVFPHDGLTLRVVIWDCGGHENVHAVIPGYLRHAHGAVIVYDLDDEDSFSSAESWMAEFRKRWWHPGKEFVLVGTKSDSPDARGSLQEGAKIAAQLNGACGAFAASAKSGANVEEAFFALIDAIGNPERYCEAEKAALLSKKRKKKMANGRHSAAKCCLC